jgi:hypothetical protein
MPDTNFVEFLFRDCLINRRDIDRERPNFVSRPRKSGGAVRFGGAGAPLSTPPRTFQTVSPRTWVNKPSARRRHEHVGPSAFLRANTAQWLKRGGMNQHLNAHKKCASDTIVTFLELARCTIESSIR